MTAALKTALRRAPRTGGHGSQSHENHETTLLIFVWLLIASFRETACLSCGTHCCLAAAKPVGLVIRGLNVEATATKAGSSRAREVTNSNTLEVTMWSKPEYTEMRFGFEVTMYIANR